MKIHLGSDHGGYQLKTKLVDYLQAAGHDVQDYGVTSESASDYPDQAAPVGRAVRADAGSLGVLVCGSGAGICIAANKVAGIRAVSPCSAKAASLARAHNNANVLCLGQRLTAEPDALAMVDAFLAGEFEGGRHAPRVEKIAQLEKAEAGAMVAPGNSR